MNWSRVKRVFLILGVLAVVAQFVQPRQTNPPIVESRTLKAHVQITPQVEAIMDRSCINCHSNRTVWPWYGHVAPFSWVVVDDVNEGRRHFNLSDWEAQNSPKEASDHLALVCKEVRDGAMPPISYRIIHKESQLSSDDINVLCSWVQNLVGPPASDQNRQN